MQSDEEIVESDDEEIEDSESVSILSDSDAFMSVPGDS